MAAAKREITTFLGILIINLVYKLQNSTQAMFEVSTVDRYFGGSVELQGTSGNMQCKI